MLLVDLKFPTVAISSMTSRVFQGVLWLLYVWDPVGALRDIAQRLRRAYLALRKAVQAIRARMRGMANRSCRVCWRDRTSDIPRHVKDPCWTAHPAHPARS